jgi:hypothetical protein
MQRWKRATTAIGAVAATTAMVLGLTATAAQAHFVSIYYDNNNAWSSNDDHTITVYTLNHNNRAAYVQVTLTRSPYNDSLWAGSSYGNNASHTWAGYVNTFRLCESGLGCGPWTVA